MNELSWFALTVSACVTGASLFEYLKNRLYIAGHLETVQAALDNNQNKLVETVSSMLVERIVPNVNVAAIEQSVLDYIVENHKDELLSLITELVTSRFEVAEVEEEKES